MAVAGDLNEKKVGSSELDLIQGLADIGISLSMERDLPKLLEKIVEEAIAFTGADGATLYLLEGEELIFTISRSVSLGIKLGGPSGDPVTFKPVPLDKSFVSAYAVIMKETVNIPDVYESTKFDFTGPKKYDANTGYRSRSMLVTPLLDHEGEAIGVLQLLNAIDPVSGEPGPFPETCVVLAASLASQAAVAILNFRLVKETERLFESFLEVMGTALDARSKYTHGHVQRVAGLAFELALAINEDVDGYYANVKFSDVELKELRIAGWTHDVGKIITPQHVMDKSVKLETIFDRGELVKTRYLLLAEETKTSFLEKEIEMLKGRASEDEIKKLNKKCDETIVAMAEERDFVLKCNNPGEFMEDAKIERLKKIAEGTVVINGETRHIISDDELKNLMIRKGSITEDERSIMQDHINVTIKMLEKVPFVKKFKNAPFYAGTHHEHLDGSGYPRGLTAKDLPVQSRILALVDFFEALTAADRPYKKAMPLEKALSIIQFEVDGGKLDGNLFNLFKEKDVNAKYFEKYNAENRLIEASN